MPIPRERLRLTAEELDELCSSVQTAHLATTSPDGSPHVVPMWFVWDGDAVWVNSLRRSRRMADLARGSRAAFCVDAGDIYAELRGAVFYGRFTEAADDPRLPDVRARFARKYWGGDEVPEIKSHVWLRLAPDRVVSWDFRKIPPGGDPRLEDSKR